MLTVLATKDSVINAHKRLVADLYKHIRGLEHETRLMKEIIKLLKGTILDHDLPLPDLSLATPVH